ncbi:MAG: translocation/assembly module TamB domain-containing protein, partial [Pseudomonadota bacterium]
ENNSNNIFIDFNAKNLNIAPFVGYLISEEATRAYNIELSGELSGNLNSRNFWDSEFSSTIDQLSLDYKANRIATKIPTNIEMKNHQLFLNEVNLVGEKQSLRLNQAYTKPYSTKFLIDSEINISFFKIVAPFFEKIDGISSLHLELTFNRSELGLIGSSFTTNAYIKFPGFPHAFENLSVDVLFNQNKVLINSISGELAQGKVLGNGQVNFKGPKEFDLFIRGDMDDIQLDFPEGFKSRGKASLSLSGSQPPFLLAGNYDVTGGLVENNFDSGSSSQNTDLLEELLKKEISSPLVVNIDIDTQKPVEVRNSLVEGYVTGSMKVYDKITTPRIKGEISFDEDSIIKFKENEFEVTNSNFKFEGQSPINPKLSLRAKTRLNQYDIDLFLQGRASKPILNVSSQPALPKNQIISMLALGQIPNQLDPTNTDTNQDQNNNTGFEIGTGLLGNDPIGKELKDRYNVDLQFSTSFDENNEAVPKVTARYKVTKKLQVSSSVTTSANSGADIRATYQLNNELSAIFRIENRADDINAQENARDQNNQNNPISLDLEYNLEFD